jgi:hypothetical protein
MSSLGCLVHEDRLATLQKYRPAVDEQMLGGTDLVG